MRCSSSRHVLPWARTAAERGYAGATAIGASGPVASWAGLLGMVAQVQGDLATARKWKNIRDLEDQSKAFPDDLKDLQKTAAPALHHAPHFLLYNQTLNPWGRERDIPQLAKQTFREWYLAHRRNNGNQHTES